MNLTHICLVDPSILIFASRPMIICFQDYSDVENIVTNGYKLKGTEYRVSRDYPKEIVTARS